MGNSFAYLVLFSWPVVTAVLFTRLDPGRAILWSLLAGFLLLPERVGVDLPGLPPLDKTTIPSLSALACAFLVARERPRLLPRSLFARLCLVLLVAGPFFTAFLNGDALVYGPVVKQGLGLQDAISYMVRGLLAIIPFLLARNYLADAGSHRAILWALFLSGLAYSLAMLFEIRMSPQLHKWVYGFFPHTWLQMERFGGFRPMVFLTHGLEVAMFAALVLGAAGALWRMAEPRAQGLHLLAIGYLSVVVVLCKTVSAWAYGLFLVPAMMLFPRRLQLLAAVGLVGLTLLYPALRSLDLFPTEPILSVASVVSEARAASLETRFDEEQALLDKALERPVFGWGSSGRNRVRDPDTGVDVSITDGAWIIVLGIDGLAGFVGTFALMAMPVLLIWWRGGAATPLATAALMLILGVNMVDLLPNSSLWPTTWMIAGALLGHAESLAPARGPAERRPARRRTRAAPAPDGGPPEPGAAGPGGPPPGPRRRPGTRRPPGAGRDAAAGPAPRGRRRPPG